MIDYFELAKDITKVYAAGMGIELEKKKDKIYLVELERTLRDDGWTMNATDLIIEAVKTYQEKPT